MAAVDWGKILSEFGVRVTYSSFETDDERGAFDGTIAEIGLPDGYFIDVSWSPDDCEYVIRLYQEYFENVSRIHFRKTVRDVLQSVIDFAESTRIGNTYTEIDGSPDASTSSATTSFVTL